MTQTLEQLIEENREKIYEPKHESTLCWCGPRFEKNADGNLEITHNEQRDFFVELLTQAHALGREEAQKEHFLRLQKELNKYSHPMPRGLDAEGFFDAMQRYEKELLAVVHPHLTTISKEKYERTT